MTCTLRLFLDRFQKEMLCLLLRLVKLMHQLSVCFLSFVQVYKKTYKNFTLSSQIIQFIFYLDMILYFMKILSFDLSFFMMQLCLFFLAAIILHKNMPFGCHKYTHVTCHESKPVIRNSISNNSMKTQVYSLCMSVET